MDESIYTKQRLAYEAAKAQNSDIFLLKPDGSKVNGIDLVMSNELLLGVMNYNTAKNVEHEATIEKVNSNLSNITNNLNNGILSNSNGTNWRLIARNNNDGTSSLGVVETIWEDDFTSGTIDATKWGYELGHVRNNEEQSYTNSSDNAFIRDGQLVIKSIKQADKAFDGRNAWTSASLHTNDIFELGGNFRIEARMKLPYVTGGWPAFWLMGASYSNGITADTTGASWADSREIDILEVFGKQTYINSTVWYKYNSTDASMICNGPHKSGTIDITQFHTYAMEREDGVLRFYVDDVLHYSYTFTDAGLSRPFYVILNLAMGSSAGNTDNTTPSENEMIVEYVRCMTLLGKTIVIPTSIALDSSTVTGIINGKQLITATVSPTTSHNQTTTWASSDTSIATVYGGQVHFLKTGTCNITATCLSYNASCVVTVAASITITDTFTRSDNTTSLGTTDTGQTWMTANNDVWGISSNKAKVYSPSGTGGYAYIDAGIKDVEVSADFTFSSYSCLVFRLSDVLNHYRVRLNSSGLGLFSVVANTATSLGSYAITPVVGTVYTIKVQILGSTIKVYLNGTLAITATDANFLTQTKFGFYNTPSNTSELFDNFSVTPITSI